MGKKPFVDSGGCCVCFSKPLDENTGISLDGSFDLHICPACWKTLTPVEKLTACQRWRETTAKMDCLRAFSDLCRAALTSNAIFNINRPPFSD